MKKLLSLTLIAASAVFCAMNVPAAEKKTEPAEKTEKKPRALPFHGTIDSVDKSAKTIKVGERVFKVTSTTKIMMAGKPATFDDAKTGIEVGGSYREVEGGKLELGSLRIGPKPEATEKKPKEEKKN